MNNRSLQYRLLKNIVSSLQWQLYPSFSFSYRRTHELDFDMYFYYLIIGPLQIRWKVIVRDLYEYRIATKEES